MTHASRKPCGRFAPLSSGDAIVLQSFCAAALKVIGHPPKTFFGENLGAAYLDACLGLVREVFEYLVSILLDNEEALEGMPR